MADELYQALGGEVGLRRLVDRFYQLMDSLPAAAHIRALHQPDLSSANQKLYEFLSGWLGGPPLFVEKYGHPRLRARHIRFPIGPAEAEAWMLCMSTALREQHPEPLAEHLTVQLGRLAVHMENQP